MSSIEEKVFGIKGLRLLILSFALEIIPVKQKHTCVISIKEYFSNVWFQIIIYCFIPRISFYFHR